MVERDEAIENEDLVIWHSFGLTHNPRVEGWFLFTSSPRPHQITRLTQKPL